MAEEESSQQQKILLLPPMKGLNLYDNPFTMDPSYALSLVNFMPPTTVMTVRPGIQKLAQMYGAVRGLYSYATGATKSYGANWYDQTITEGERELLLLKFSQNQGDSVIYSFNPLSLQCESIANISDHTYTKDATNFKHSIFLCSGSQSSPMYVWNSRVGFKPMEWRANADISLSDLENITYYNGYLFANSYNTFDIFYMEEAKADPTIHKSGWDDFWSFFSPTYAGQFSVDGIAHKGGSILKMFTMTRSGLNDTQSYLVICTNMGEIILYQGSPGEEGGFKATGRFEIPVPLNKDCFAQMEGDIIVATRNGLVSLMRVVFGQTTNVTQSLETRIKNLFSDYMFRMNEFRAWIKLFYNFKNRLLILNVPTQMPIPLKQIEIGYEFTKEQVLMLPDQYDGGVTRFLGRIAKFIRKYLYTNWIDYKIFLQFNDSVSEGADGIYISFETLVKDPVDLTSYETTTTVKFYIICNKERTNFFENDLIFTCVNFTDAGKDVVFSPGQTFQWNQKLKKTYEGITYYGFAFPDPDPEKVDDFTVTNIITQVDLFARDGQKSTLVEYKKGAQLKDFKMITSQDDLSHYDFIDGFPRDKTYNEFEKYWYDGARAGYHIVGPGQGVSGSNDVEVRMVDPYFANHAGEIPQQVPLILKNVVKNVLSDFVGFRNICPHADDYNPDAANKIIATIDYTLNHAAEPHEEHFTMQYTIAYYQGSEYNVVAVIKLQIINGIGIKNKGVLVYRVQARFNAGNHLENADKPDAVTFDDWAPPKYEAKGKWTLTNVEFDDDYIDLSDNSWVVSNVTFNVTGDTKGIAFFCGAGANQVFTWNTEKVIDTDDLLRNLNEDMAVYPLSIFILENNPPQPPPPPVPPGDPIIFVTINDLWKNWQFEFTNNFNKAAFMITDEFASGALGEEEKIFNKTFNDLADFYNELGNNVLPHDVPHPTFIEGVDDVFYNVANNFVRHCSAILAKPDFKVSGSSGRWTWEYQMQYSDKDGAQSVDMSYNIDYHYSYMSGNENTVSAEYSITFNCMGTTYATFFTGRIVFIIKEDSYVEKIQYGDGAVFTFKQDIDFDSIPDIILQDKTVTITNADWKFENVKGVDITDILMEDPSVFPNPKDINITDKLDVDEIDDHYGWMFSNFGIYVSNNMPTPPVPPAPPQPVQTLQNSINECWDDEFFPFAGLFTVEDTFKTGNENIKDKEFNQIFTNLVKTTYKNGTYKPNTVPNPNLGVGEVIGNVTQNALEHQKETFDTLSVGGKKSKGKWTYGYDYINEGNTYIASIEYVVSYDYNLQSEKLLVCKYSISLNYTNYTETTQIPKGGEVFNGTINFQGDELSYINTITFSNFTNIPLNFNNFNKIDLTNKNVVIKNAQWSLNHISGGDLTDILTNKDQPVFPTPKKGDIKDQVTATQMTNSFYGWMFSNFALWDIENPENFKDTINDYFSGISYADIISFRIESIFHNNNVDLKGKDYNKVFSDLADAYDGKEGVRNPLPNVAELINRVSEHLYRNFGPIKDKLQDGENTGKWNYGYDIYEDDIKLAHMEYEIDYNYSWNTTDKNITASYKILLKYDNYMVEPAFSYGQTVLEGSVITTGNEDKIWYGPFHSYMVPFHEFERLDLEERIITIRNAKWSIETTKGADITSMLTNSPTGWPHVFPLPGTDEITNDDMVKNINTLFYGWMFSSFAFYGGSKPPVPPPPPSVLKDSINNYYGGETLPAFDYCQEEDTFKTGVEKIKDKEYNQVFTDLVTAYQNHTYAPNDVPNPFLNSGIGELIYNVVENGINSISGIYKVLNTQGSQKDGTWTYTYEIYDSNTHTASIEYVITYAYRFVDLSNNGVECEYHINLTYAYDMDKPTPVTKSYDFFGGIIDFNLQFPLQLQDSINDYYGGETLPAFDYCQEEDTFKTGALVNNSYNKVFADLAAAYNNAQQDPSPIPLSNVPELIRKVGDNLYENFVVIKDKLGDGNNKGQWTYEYDIYEGDTKLVHIEYQIYYNYLWDETNKNITAEYQIGLRYEDYTVEPSFSYEQTVLSGSVIVGGGKRWYGPFNSNEFDFSKLKKIDLKGKNIKINNASWSLDTTVGADITDILVGGSHPAFPSPKSSDIASKDTADYINNNFYGWMFSNFAFYSKEEGGDPTVKDIMYHDFASTKISFDEFEILNLKNKAIGIKGKWDIGTVEEISIKRLISGDHKVFPAPWAGEITSSDIAGQMTNSYYGWMFSNFAFYDGGSKPPVPPVPPPTELKYSINDYCEGETLTSIDHLKAEDTFKTVALWNRGYKEVFDGLVNLYNGTFNYIPNPNLGVGELIYNATHQCLNDYSAIMNILGGNTSKGHWAYWYEIYEGNTKLVGIEYVVSYKYNAYTQSDNTHVVKYTYSISLNYTDYTEKSPITKKYDFFHGDMVFSIFEWYPHVTEAFNFNNFSNSKVPFDDFNKIDLKGKNVVVKNAQWSLENDEGPDLTNELIYGLFPSPKAGEIKDSAKASTMTNSYYGWMFSNFAFYGSINQEIVEETKESPKNISREVFKKVNEEDLPVIIVPRDPGVDPDYPPHVQAVKNTNFDLSLIPLFTGVNILAPFRSSQYVMDSLYGTWSQWQDINMVDGIEHVNEFYFIIPQDFKPSSTEGGFIYNESFLCKFNTESSGDFEDMLHPENTKAIIVNYKTAASNFGSNNIKEISKIKLYGTGSTFWGQYANQLKVTMHSDFFANPYQKYLHTKEPFSVRKALGLGEDYDLSILTYSQIKEYRRLYLEASLNIKNIEMGLICKPANRIALEVDMEIKEHNIIIYGYELYFKILNKL